MPRRRGGPTGSGIQYIRDKIPDIDYPPYDGRSYSASVPDTLDLQQRCALSLHGITSLADPEADYEIYGWMGTPQAGTIIAKHSYHDYNGGQAKWIEDLPLLRTASGSRENFAVDRRMMEILFHMLGPDRLYYIPVVGAPWSMLRDPNELAYADMSARQIFNSWPNGRALLALSAWYDRDHNPILRKMIERMVDGFAKIAIHRDGSCYFYEKKFDDRVQSSDMPVRSGASVTQSTIISGLAFAYKETGYEPARQLALELAKFILGPAQMLREDGSFYEQVHFHGTTFALLGILELGLSDA